MYGYSGVCFLFFIKESIESPLKIALFVVIAAQLPTFPRRTRTWSTRSRVQ